MTIPSSPALTRRTLLATALGGLFMSTLTQAAPLLSIANRAVRAPNAWIEVDLSTFDNNLRHVQGTLEKTTQLCAILKADAYGVGISPIMPSLLHAGVPCIGITSNEEARVVRADGFKGRLMRVRTATPDVIDAALPYSVEELVGNLALAQAIGTIAQRRRQPIRVHLALNSGGMSRNGLELGSDRGKQDAVALVQTAGVRIVGVMTHFAVEDKDDVLRGLAAFHTDTGWLFSNTELKRNEVILHVANSFATLNVPTAHLDMVRVGAALYGYIGPRPAFDYVIAFKTRVASVNAYAAGSTVGYDRTFTLKRDTLLANLPMGHSDGYRRTSASEGVVLVRGHRAAVIGKVSMNTTMVDVTDIPGVSIGDEVVLFGKQGHQQISEAEIEQLTGVPLADQHAAWGSMNPKVVVR